MGLLSKLLVLLSGLVFFVLGAWPLGLALFVYLLWSARGRSRRKEASTHHADRLRPYSALGLSILALVAYLSGGTYSVLLFAGMAGAAASWPSAMSWFGSELEPVDGTLLLRSKRLPILWTMLAEVKLEQSDVPRSMSSFRGTMIVLCRSGRVLVAASCVAIGSSRAEASILERLRGSSAGSLHAPLLPLNSTDSAGLLCRSLSRVRYTDDDLTKSPGSVDVVAVRVEDCRISAYGAYGTTAGSTSAVLPRCNIRAAGSPLLWEFFEALEKNVRWPEPDGLSAVVGSLRATAGAPIGERMDSLESKGDGISVGVPGSDKVSLSRAQLRALAAIYS